VGLTLSICHAILYVCQGEKETHEERNEFLTIVFIEKKLREKEGGRKISDFLL
jgi:hypothetical protein